MPARQIDTLAGARGAYLDALLEHDEAGARAVIDQALAAGAPVRALYLEVLQPALYEVGERWADGRLSVAGEHHASMVTRRLLTLLGERMRVAPRDGRLAVVGCSPGELHELGAQMIADFLEAEAWEVLRLGASVPVDDLAELVEHERPDVVALSTAMPDRLEAAEDALRALAAVRPRPLIVVGGRGWTARAVARASELGADLVVDDPGTLVDVLSSRFPPVDEPA
jgi:methanogenic corrinoid protein MtbC1